MDETEKRQMCVETGERIRRLREETNMTKERLAEAADISIQYVSDIEQGRKCMGFTIFAEIARALHVSMETLAYGYQKEDPAVRRVAEYLMDLPPVERELAAKALMSAAGAARALGPETWNRGN